MKDSRDLVPRAKSDVHGAVVASSEGDELHKQTEGPPGHQKSKIVDKEGNRHQGTRNECRKANLKDSQCAWSMA